MHQNISQPSLENQYIVINRDTQLDHVWKMREFGALSLKWDLFIKSFSSLRERK